MAARLVLHEHGVDDLRLEISGANPTLHGKSHQATSPSFIPWIHLKTVFWHLLNFLMEQNNDGPSVELFQKFWCVWTIDHMAQADAIG